MSRTPLALIALLATCAALGPLQLNVYLPSLPLVQRGFDADVADVQWTVSLAMASYGLGLLLFGPLSDRFGRRPVMLGGLALFSIASLLAAAAPTLAALTASRTLQSAAASIVFITSRAVVADRTPRELLHRSVAQLTMIVLTTQMIAPLIGNIAISYGGWRAIQYGLAALAVLLTFLVGRHLHETLQRPATEPALERGIGVVLRPTAQLVARRGFALQLLQIGLLYSAYPAFVAIAPHLMIEVFERPPTDYGYYFALLPLGYFAGNAFVLRFGRSYSGPQLIRTGSLFACGAALCAAALLAGVFWHPLALFVPAGLLLNFGLGIALPSAMARALGQAWPSTASAWGLAGFSQQVIGACGVQVLGFFPADSPYPVLALCAALAGAPALLERWLRLRSGESGLAPGG